MWQKYKKRIISIGVVCAVLALILYHLPEHSEYIITFVDLNTGEQHSLTMNFVRFRKLFMKLNNNIEWEFFSGKVKGTFTFDGVSYGQFERRASNGELRDLKKMAFTYDPNDDSNDGKTLSSHFSFESDTTMSNLFLFSEEYVYIPQIDEYVYRPWVMLDIYESYYPEPTGGRIYSLKTLGDKIASYEGELTDIRRVSYIPFSLQKNPIR